MCRRSRCIWNWAAGREDLLLNSPLANLGKNLLAVDISSNMLGVARRKIDAAFSQAGKAPGNVRLAAYDIERIGEILSEQDTVERIFINFCNPWPRRAILKRG